MVVVNLGGRDTVLLQETLDLRNFAVGRAVLRGELGGGKKLVVQQPARLYGLVGVRLQRGFVMKLQHEGYVDGLILIG
jgi:hypothetical protein